MEESGDFDRNYSPPGNPLKKTDYSWISGNTNNGGRASNPLTSTKDRQKEVKRLEKAVERLLINLGSDQDPTMYRNEIPEEEELERESEKPLVVKKQAEDNKLSNTMRSVQPTLESAEREMESYVNTLRNGYLGIGSGVASPIEIEIEDESINIVKP